jgi:hypothetical protein
MINVSNNWPARMRKAWQRGDLASSPQPEIFLIASAFDESTASCGAACDRLPQLRPHTFLEHKAVLGFEAQAVAKQVH